MNHEIIEALIKIINLLESIDDKLESIYESDLEDHGYIIIKNDPKDE